MDRIKNPYTPGAGTPPPELAGRDELRETARIALERIRAGRHTKSIMMVGLRGVGKTVLLDRLREDAECTCAPWPSSDRVRIDPETLPIGWGGKSLPWVRPGAS
jgi:hypothetical protein